MAFIIAIMLGIAVIIIAFMSNEKNIVEPRGFGGKKLAIKDAKGFIRTRKIKHIFLGASVIVLSIIIQYKVFPTGQVSFYLFMIVIITQCIEMVGKKKYCVNK